MPLAEIISQVTAAEFKNLGIQVKEFYKWSPQDSLLQQEADKANLILFEGHTADQHIFPYPDFEPLEFNENSGMDEFANQQRKQKLTRRHLKGMPLVFLQSCNSLDPSIAEQIFEGGGVGLVGSVTSIHSASGSSFAKAFCNSLLYQKGTVGEALRDARNFFFCLARLKTERGHEETAKVRRVALSFRLFGDPELQVFPGLKTKPRRLSIKAGFTKSGKIKISLPSHYLQKVENEKYFARIFPGSTLAGLVKRIKNKDERRIMLLFFFRLALPSDFIPERRQYLWRRKDKTVRAVFLTDVLRQHIYILYFPKKEKKKEDIYLKFHGQE